MNGRLWAALVTSWASAVCPAAARAGLPATATSWLVDAARERGLLFEHRSGDDGHYWMPEIMSGGAALFDMDGDGDLDAYLVQAGSVLHPTDRPPNQLFRNRGDGTFEDITEGSGAGHRGYGNGVAAGDYDQDGDIDLYVTNLGPNVLLENLGDGTFVDVTDAVGVGDPGWGASATFFDFDRDRDLDLFVVNYLDWSAAVEMECYDDLGRRDYCSPGNYSLPARDVLYRNDDGTFVEVTREMGLDAFGNGLGVVASDVDADGWPDLMVANDGSVNQLWMNQGGTSFVDEALLWGVAVDQEGKVKAGMGVTSADFDRDGDFDLLVCNLVDEGDSLFRNEGGYFVDASARSGLAAASRGFTRFGVGWVDFDNDGMLDLFEANGKVGREGRTWAADPYAEPDLVLRGVGDGRFVPVPHSGRGFVDAPTTSRAAAFGDVDGDGGIDVLTVSRDGPAGLLRNVVAPRGAWVVLDARNGVGAPALGAVIAAELDDRVVRREVRAGGSYQASSDPRVHLGLGTELGVGRVEVLWPWGGRECFGPFDAGAVHVLSPDRGAPCEPESGRESAGIAVDPPAW